MCGRYTLQTPKEVLSARFRIRLADRPELACRYNIAPTQPVLTVRSGRAGERDAAFMRWGLVPAWAKQPKELPQMINARVESVAARPAYRDSFRRQRCLILADGFYEWRRASELSPRKTPYWISLEGGQPFAMAGLWARWVPTDDLFAEPVLSCTILTTAANPTVAPIHERMPLILQPDREDAWLDPALDGDVKRLKEFLRSDPESEALCARPVSLRVNSPDNDGPDLIREFSDPREGF